MYRLLSHKVAASGLFVLVLDLTLAPLIRFGAAAPVFSYMLVLYSAFHWGLHRTLPVAVFVGILRDITSSETLGAETFSLALFALVLNGVLHKLDRNSVSVRMIACFIFLNGVLAATFFLNRISGTYLRPFVFSTVMVILKITIYTIFLSPFFFGIAFRWFHEKKIMREYGTLSARL